MLNRLSAPVWFLLVWCTAARVTLALASPALASPAFASPASLLPVNAPSADSPASLAPVAAPSEARAHSSAPTQREWTLPNGVQVTLTPFETDQQATVRLVFGIGTADETRSEAGLTRILAEWMTRANAEPGAVTFSPTVSLDETVLNVNVAASAVPDAIACLRTLVDNAAALANASDVGSDDRFTDARSAVADSPRHRASHADARQALRSVLFEEEAYGRPDATTNQIRSYTRADLQSFAQRHLTPKRTRLYVVGSFRPSEAEAAANTHLGAWAASLSAPPRSVTPVADASLRLFERPGATEATLAVGAPVPEPGHKDATALQVAAVLIGGGHASCLAQADDVPFTSSPYSLVAAHRDASYWAAVVSTRATHAQPALQTVRRILDNLRSSPPDTASVVHAQTVLVDRFLLQSSTRDGLAEQLMFLHRHNLSTTYFLTYQERVQSVTPDDVRRVVKTYLSPERLTTVATGPKRLLQPQLAPFRERMP